MNSRQNQQTEIIDWSERCGDFVCESLAMFQRGKREGKRDSSSGVILILTEGSTKLKV